MCLGETSASQLSQPEVEGKWRILVVRGKLSGGIQEDFLDQVGGIKSATQPRIEPQPDHAAEPVPVGLHELLPGNSVAGRRPSDGRLRGQVLAGLVHSEAHCWCHQLSKA